MGSGGGSNTTTIDKNLLPDYAQPYVESYLSRANTLSTEAYASYTGTTYAGQNSDELDGITRLADRGRNSHPIITKGETLLRDILDGLKINTNPKTDQGYLKRAESLIQEFEEETLPRLAHQYNNIGNYGGSAHNLAQAKAAEVLMAKLSETGLDLYFADYLIERGYMESALGRTVPYGTQKIADADLLRQAGLYAREYLQGSYNDAYRKFIDEQEASIKRLEILGNAIRALVGSRVSKTEPFYRPSTLSQVAGIALAGAGIVAGMYKGFTPNSSPFGTTGTADTGAGGAWQNKNQFSLDMGSGPMMKPEG